jgi:hypothetical protein
MANEAYSEGYKNDMCESKTIEMLNIHNHHEQQNLFLKL